MESLNSIFQKYKGEPGTMIDGLHAEWGGDKGSTHSYIQKYDELFTPLRDKNINLLEIGVMYGSSVKMWKDYFPNGQIYGVDIREVCKKYEDERINISIMDATKYNDVFENLSQVSYDIIIDDGSHQLHDQIATFKLLISKLNPGGIYVIEDIQDIDKSRPQLEKLYPGIEIVDNRNINNRYDDVLVVLKKPLIDKSWSSSGNDISFRGNNTEEHWVNKHKQQYEVNKDFDFTGMTDLSYIKVAGDLIIGNQDKFNRKSILDVGCAVGKAVKYFKDKLPSFECTGWDFSESGIVAAREKIPNCTFEQRDIILNPIDTEYGCITMMETIEHLQEGTNYKVLDNILDHCEYAIVSTVDTEDNCFGEHISHYKIDTFDKKGYDVVWKSPLDVINMPEGLFHYVIFLIKGKL